MMKLPTATHLALALLVTVGSGASGGSAWAQRSTAKKPTAAKSSTAKKSGKKSSKKTTSTRGRKKGQTAPTSDRITEIQRSLAKDGSYSSTPTGKWDDSTMAAMKKFQEAHGLNPSGKLDAKTLQQLGLGSETAGIAAPLPPVSSSSSKTSSRTIARKQ